MKVFVPYSDEMLDALGFSGGNPMAELVPFNLDYECLRRWEILSIEPADAMTDAVELQAS